MSENPQPPGEDFELWLRSLQSEAPHSGDEPVVASARLLRRAGRRAAERELAAVDDAKIRALRFRVLGAVSRRLRESKAVPAWLFTTRPWVPALAAGIVGITVGVLSAGVI